MKLVFDGIVIRDTKKLEEHLRLYKDADNFSDAFEAIWTFVSDDFIREFAEKLDLGHRRLRYELKGEFNKG